MANTLMWRNVALVIVDAQNMWFHPNGLRYLADAERQIPIIKELASTFRLNGSPVIYTKVVWESEEDLSAPLMEVRSDFPKDVLRRGDFSGEIHSDLSPTAGDHIVEKKYFDAFATGNMAEVLNRIQEAGGTISTLVFTGTTLNNCVYSSVLGAAQFGIFTVAVRDAISTSSQDEAEHWYKQMQRYLGTQVVGARDLIEMLSPTRT
jgi:nicotinamidase-related amidase